MSTPNSSTIDLDKLRRETYESLPKERLVEIAIEKSKEVMKLRDEILTLRQFVVGIDWSHEYKGK